MRGPGPPGRAAMMNVTILPVTPFQQNCSILRCGVTGRGAVVDPGGELDRIRALLQRERIEPEKILVTHAHIDHAGGVAELARVLGVAVEGPHPDDRFWIDALAEQARMFGFPASGPFMPDRWLGQGDVVQFGAQRLDVLHCPGHTPGHVVFHHAAERLAFVGDVLFRGSIGRTDFPRGDYDTLIESICSRLWPLGDDVRFVPGHGPMSTFGEERRSNPFVGDAVTGLG
jgi:glyoxylase-like metal-dependent hydrolase (beta-lactamase superfamily II)